MTLREPPLELLEYRFLRAFPGYTREQMYAEPEGWVLRMLATETIIEDEVARQRRRDRRRRGR